MRWFTLLGLFVLTALAGAADESKSKKADSGKASSTGEKNDRTAAARGLDKLKLPKNAVVVVCEKFEDALRLVPSLIVLTPEKYRELLNRIAELERKLKPDRPASPSTCKLKVLGASLDGELARIEAEFKFRADRDKTLIALGCQGANPKKPELDGKETLLRNGENGFVVEADAGEHVLTLELELPVAARGAGALGGGPDRGCKIELPRAAVTTLELEQLPAGVKEVRCNDLLVRRHGEILALGAADRLNLAWKKPALLTGRGPLLTAEGKITVRVEDRVIITEAELTLQDLSGQTSKWLLGTPPQTTVEVLPADERDGRGTSASVSSSKKNSEHVIQLKEASADSFRVLLQVNQRRAEGRIPIGAFRVLNAERQQATLLRQQGTLLVKAPADVRLEYHRPGGPRVTVSRRELTEEQRRAKVVAVFKYWNVPGRTKPAPRPAAAPPLLELELKTIKGVVETQVKHLLHLEAGEQGWQVQAVCTITATSQRAAVGALEVQLPRAWPDALAVLACWPRPGLPVNLALAAGTWGGSGQGALWPFGARYDLDRNASIADPIDAIDPAGTGAGRVSVKLVEKKEGKFTLTLSGVYQLSRGARRAVLELPRPLRTIDRGGEVEVRLPPEQELLVGEAGQEVPAAEGRTYRLATETAPDRVEFAWRPYRPELPVTVESDVTLTEGRGHVRQRLQLPTGAHRPRQLLLRLAGDLPAGPPTLRALGQSLHVTSGGRLEAGADADAWPVGLQLGRDRTLELEYDFPLAAAGLLRVPLLWPEQATRVDTRVRVWSEPGAGSGTVVALEGRRWREQKTEVVPGRDRLPALVLQGHERDLPLVLRLSRTALPPLASALVERGLIQVIAAPDGGQTYRARFRVRKFNSRTLDVALAGPGARLRSVLLDGKYLTPRKLPDGVSRLEIEPDRYPRPVILELIYQGAAEESASSAGPLANWLTTLHPPLLRGAVFLGRIRWQVERAPGEVVLNPADEAVTELAWGMQGWLLTPRPALTGAELEEWLTGTSASAPDEDGGPGLLCWQTVPQPLTLVHVSQKTWLLVCSLLLLALGLALSFVPLSHGPFRALCWMVVAALGLGAAAVAVLWPGVMPAVVYGCEPGFAVLVLVVAVQWMLQRRYRRQLVFMPGFTRLKPGSSLVRAGSSNRPREPSTVDVPPAPEKPGSVVSGP
jgi:hypothetical protein